MKIKFEHQKYFVNFKIVKTISKMIEPNQIVFQNQRLSISLFLYRSFSF